MNRVLKNIISRHNYLASDAYIEKSRRFRVWKHVRGFSQDSTLALRDSGRQVWLSLRRRDRHAMRALVDLDSAEALLENRRGGVGYPLLSCLMPTYNRFLFAQRAVECFGRQSYPNKELVIVDNSPGDELGRWVASLQDSRLRYIGLKDKRRRSLGVLRNISVEHARGEYVALWDDDDLSHPERLILQMQLMLAVGADAAFLHSETLWWPARKRLVEMRRWQGSFWQNTMVLRQDKANGWTDVSRDVDGIFCRKLMPDTDIAVCEMPGLYLRLVHGGNTTRGTNLENYWRRFGKVLYTRYQYNRDLHKFSRAFGFDLHRIHS